MPLERGLSSPVIVAESVDWNRDYEDTPLAELLAQTDEQLAAVDPLAMNLVVAKGIPSLAPLRIESYQRILNGWAQDFAGRCLPGWEPYFWKSPADFHDDIEFFRLGMACQYLETEIGVQYISDQRETTTILYTNPADLFLNGLLDTGQGTCGNLAALQVAFCWRLGWPVSLARVHSHYICRFDNGRVTYNIEATQSGHGGFKSDPDEYLMAAKKLPASAITSGSDLRALRPREVLGEFIGLRARHLRDVGLAAGDERRMLASEEDWLLARQLCPTSRPLYKNQVFVSALRGAMLFEWGEPGHPLRFGDCLKEIRRRHWRTSSNPAEPCTGESLAERRSRMEVG